MRPLLSTVLAAGLVCLSGCGTGAPLAPLGLDKQPANTPETVASLLATGDHTPSVVPPEPIVASATAAVPTSGATMAPIRGPFVISDFTVPGGIGSLQEPQRRELIAAAKSATIVVLLVRGDHAQPSRANWNRLVRRGVLVKRFLVAEGVAPGKIRIFVRSAGAFVADNGSIDGRARNRRVEIQFSEVDHGQRT